MSTRSPAHPAGARAARLGARTELQVVRLGRIDYAEAWSLQREMIERRATGAGPDTLLVCEHPHVITVGRASGEGTSLPSVLAGPDGPIPVVRIERGGLATYHGPGQIVIYPILRLDRIPGGLDAYLRLLEKAAIRACDAFGIRAVRKDGCTGVWTPAPAAGAPPRLKLASIGVAVRRWVTYHGLALNVNTDLRCFRLIRPCGMDPDIMTSMASLRGGELPMRGVEDALIAGFLALVRS